ncbi:hypothetical protein D3C81_2092640 [compost metagenome]
MNRLAAMNAKKSVKSLMDDSESCIKLLNYLEDNTDLDTEIINELKKVARHNYNVSKFLGMLYQNM